MTIILIKIPQSYSQAVKLGHCKVKDIIMTIVVVDGALFEQEAQS